VARSRRCDRRFPRIAVALAGARARASDTAGALSIVQELGPAGGLTRPAQVLLASLLSQAGSPRAAEDILDRLFVLDFSAYQAARDRFDAAVGGRTKELRSEALSSVTGGAEPTSRSESQRVATWIDEKLLDDPDLRALLDEVKSRSQVVDLALQLGTIRLERAQGEAGDARRVTLARAEKDFLAIASEAEGSAQYHLGLGQVYHRMGRAEEGDRELDFLLAKKNPILDLQVVRVYRDLDLIPHARKLALSVHQRAPIAEKHEAALILSLMADSESKRSGGCARPM
jgi:hypothetical protein